MISVRIAVECFALLGFDVFRLFDVLREKEEESGDDGWIFPLTSSLSLISILDRERRSEDMRRDIGDEHKSADVDADRFT